uniref:Cytochrome c oxidase subunit 3 n=1 Tax=Steganacarus magnus TaxID=52000 RepID=B6Z5U8_9ACAR|nr:cytochrome c oxidase subunit III [Steganacarus magnus]ACH41149.1 cytochrome c oxidase subunit III [Steganacarus magnus]
MMFKLNTFHFVFMSPWPLFVSFSSFNFFLSIIIWMNYGNFIFLIMAMFNIMFCSYVWWRDVDRESSFLGSHSLKVKYGLKFGMILFIVSEVMFFFSFFWSFIHGSSSSDVTMGASWPPEQVFPFDPMSVPLVNTIVLLSSGASVTWSHHSILKNKMMVSSISLFFTIMLGVFFTILQYLEYLGSPFSISDSDMGSTFFMATGFHGIHVIIGSTFLMIEFIKNVFYVNTNSQIVGFECSAWYWHFVDVIWLFLYSLIYWWGS